jgi:hypothetical protein
MSRKVNIYFILFAALLFFVVNNYVKENRAAPESQTDYHNRDRTEQYEGVEVTIEILSSIKFSGMIFRRAYLCMN